MDSLQTQSLFIGGDVGFTGTTPDRVIGGPLLPGDQVEALTIVIRTTGEATDTGTATIRVAAVVSDSADFDTAAAFANKKHILGRGGSAGGVLLPLQASYTGTAGKISQFLQITIPLLHVAMQRERYLGVEIQDPDNTFTLEGSVFFKVFRPIPQPK